MSETRRPVTVDVVYDGDYCSVRCPFNANEGYFCSRHDKPLGVYGISARSERLDECKAEDPPAKPEYPKE